MNTAGIDIALAEKRRELRRPAYGMVHLKVGDPAQEIVGRLLDVSDSGFRMSHDYMPLGAGQVVEFRHSHATGQARVVWNRIQADRAETGFLLLK
jgi:hypothetical protein